MSAWLKMMWNGLLCRDVAFVELRDRGDAFMRGVIIVSLISLVVGLPALVMGVVHSVRPTPIAVEMDAAMSEFDAMVRQIQPMLGNMPDAALDTILTQVKDNMRFGFDIAQKIDALPTRLPKPLNRLFTAFGTWVSRPFADSSGFPLSAALLATWLGYGIWVMLFAKLLGGKGTLTGFYGATSLFAVPHLLSFFAFVPAVSAILSFVAFVWGVAIYVKGTEVSHRMSMERALLAVVLPLLVVALLVLITVLVSVMLVVIGAASGA